MKRIFGFGLALAFALAFLGGCTPAAPVSAPEDTTTTMVAAATTATPLGGVQLDFGKQVYLWVNADGSAARVDPISPAPYADLDVAGLSAADAVTLILQTAYADGDIVNDTVIQHSPADSYNGFDTAPLDAQVQDAIDAFIGTLASSGVSVSVSEATQASTTRTIPPDLTTVPPTTVTVPGTTTTTTTITTTTAAATTVPPLGAGTYQAYAAQTLTDMYNTWWTTGLASGGNVIQTGWGVPGPPYDGMIWSYAMMTFGIYTYWEGAKGADQAARLQAQYNWTRIHVSNYTTGFGGAPNIAVDDSGWDAMYLMQAYMATGDTRARSDALALIQGAYNYYKDGNTANGLWYPQYPPSVRDNCWGVTGDNRFKSVYSVGLLSAALDFLLDAKSRDANWQTTYAQLYTDTLNIYNWSEAHLLRGGNYTVTLQDSSTRTLNCSDNLYWCDYSIDRPGRTERTGPDGGLRPNSIGEAGSVSSLLGNMGMAVCHSLLWQLTGDTQYRDRAVRTAQAITNSSLYNKGGVLVNDRDGWTDATFAGRYVQEVLTLPGIRTADTRLILNTGASAFNNARTQIEGKYYYKAEWSGGTAWINIDTTPDQIMTSGDTANMILAAGLLETLQQQGKAP